VERAFVSGLGTAVSALTGIAANDDASVTDVTSRASFAATVGATFVIVVDGYLGSGSGLATGTVALHWRQG
jgi:hypothetical protein